MFAERAIDSLHPCLSSATRTVRLRRDNPKAVEGLRGTRLGSRATHVRSVKTVSGHRTAQFHWRAMPRDFRFHLHGLFGDFFTIFRGAIGTACLTIITGGAAGGRSSIWI